MLTSGWHKKERFAHCTSMKLRTRITRAANVLLRGYDAAGPSNRWPLPARMPAPATEAQTARAPLGQKAAYLKANSPHVAAAVIAWVNNMVADGPTLQYDDPRIVESWNAWWSRCDWEQISDLGGFLQRAVECWIVYGEAFILQRTDPDTGEERLHLIPVEQVDASKNEDLGGGHVIVSGIEIDQGRRVAYWLLPTPPDAPFAGSAESSPVPAADVIHMFIPPWPGATRGVTLLAPILTRAVEVDKLEDAYNALANVCALLGIYITDPSGNVTLGTPIAGNRAEVSAEPGTVRIVPAELDGDDGQSTAVRRRHRPRPQHGAVDRRRLRPAVRACEPRFVASELFLGAARLDGIPPPRRRASKDVARRTGS